MCARLHAVQQKPSPWLLGSHNPIPCRSDSEICGFWCLNNLWATLHHQHIASHQLRITAQGPSYNNPPCRLRSSIAGPWRGKKISWAPCIRTPSDPYGVWRFFWRRQAPSQRRGLLIRVVALGRFCLDQGMLMREVVVDGSRISGIVVVEQISLLAKVLWNDLKYIETCVLKAF